MKLNRIRKTGFAVMALSLFAIPAHAQNNGVHVQDRPAITQSNAIGGCTNANDLLDQAEKVINKLRKITPAAYFTNQDKLTDTLRDLKARAEILKYRLADCFNNESILGTWSLGKGPMPIKMRMIATEIDYLNFVYQTRFTEGDKSYFANAMPPDIEQKIPECKGVLEFLPKAEALVKQSVMSTDITPRDVEPFHSHGKQLLDCGLALVKSGHGAAAYILYGDAAGLANAMVIAGANVEAKLNRALAIPAVQTQPIIIQYGPKSCTGHVWGSENRRTINWDCN